MTILSLHIRLHIAGFIAAFLAGDYDEQPLQLARALDKLAADAWEEVRESVPPAARFE
jgi:hypothetical protein